MIEGITKSGFRYRIEDEALDDYELLEDFCEVDKGNTSLIVSVAARILGKEQKEALKNHVRGEHGRVSASKMVAEIMEILSSNNQGKN